MNTNRTTGHFSASRKAIIIASSLIINLGIASTSVIAQDIEELPELEEIVVTAQFKEQRLQDVPIAISAYSADTIESRGVTNIADVANTAPSVQINEMSSAFSNSISVYIRGFGQYDFNPAFEPGVGMYIDDVYFPRLVGANFDLLDVDRVEVLRGPQGTLTGKNSEGGAIKFFTKKPTGENSYIYAEAGQRNKISIRGAYEFSLSEALKARLSGALTEQDGYVDQVDYDCYVNDGSDCIVGDLGDTNYKAIKAFLAFDPSDTFSAILSMDYVKDERNNSPEILLYANNSNPNVALPDGTPFDSRFLCGDTCSFTTLSTPSAIWVDGAIPFGGLPVQGFTAPEKNTLDSYNVSLNMSGAITDNLNWTSISAYREWENTFGTDGDLSPATGQLGSDNLDHWFWSQEFRISAEFTQSTSGTFGVYLSDEKTVYNTIQDLRYVAVPLPTGPLPLFPLQFENSDPIRTKSDAVFATIETQATESLKLTAGLRYTEDSKSYIFERLIPGTDSINAFLDAVGGVYGRGYEGPDSLDADMDGDTTEIVASLTGSEALFEAERLDYRLSADYRINDDVMIYATTATGYKSGGVGPRPFNAAQAQSFGEEEVTLYELGLKTTLFSNRLRFNAAIYQNDFTDAQLTLVSCPQFGGPGPCALPQNAGDATTRGLEIEIQARPIDGMIIDLTGSVLDWEWDCVNGQVVGAEDNGCSTDSAILNTLSSPPQGVVENTFNIGIQYDWNNVFNGTLSARLDVNYTDEQKGGLIEAEEGSPTAELGGIDSRTLTNARISWTNANDDLDISLIGKNLADKYYFANKFDLTGAGAGTIAGVVGRPREISVSLKKRF